MKNRNSFFLSSAILQGLGVAAFALVFISCGSNTSTGGNTAPDPVTSHNNPGTGSSSYLVTVDINANNNINVIGGFSIDYNVDVQDGLQNPVDSVIVTIQNPTLGTITLPETRLPIPGQAGSGTYRLTGGVFPTGDFQLDIVKGTNNIHGVVVGGPMIFSVLYPLQNDTLKADSAFTVRWTVPIAAKSTDVETHDFGPQSMADLGSLLIQGVDNPARANQRIRVTRSNEVDIAGGLAGSMMRITMRITVEPVIVQ